MKYIVRKIKSLRDDERGVTTVEVILVLVVLLAVVVIFRDQLMSIVEDIFSNVSSTISGLYG